MKMQPTVTLYTKDYCPHCKAAKALFTAKGIAFTNYEISNDPVRRREMISLSDGRKTVPQIFIGEFHVGGNSDLVRLDKSGTLDGLLQSSRAA